MRISFLLLLLLFSGTGFSQNSAVGLSLGASFSTISNNPYVIPEIEPGFTAVAHYQRGYKWLLFQAALDFTQKGYTQKVIYMDSNGDAVGFGHADFTFNYVGISLKAGAQYGGRLFGNTTIGITPAYLGSAYYDTEEIEEIDVPGQHVRLEHISTFDLSLGLETTIGYKLAERSAVFLTAGANMGLWNVQPSSLNNAGSWKNYYGSLRIGYQFYLKNTTKGTIF